MPGDTISTPMRPLTFFDRMRLTWVVLCVHLRAWAAFAGIVWSSGATVSSSLTDLPKGRSATVTVTSEKRSVSVTVTPE
jgi:hypothetical protein